MLHLYADLSIYYLKNMVPRNAALFLILGLSCFWSLRFAESKLPQDEVDALQKIATTMGAKYWEFNGDSCQVGKVGVTTQAPRGSESTVDCPCNFENDTYCHVVRIVLKGYSLPGVLPPELVKLPYLQDIDFAYNYLSGTIPHEWASMQLNSISVLANRLSGEIPNELGNISSLTYLSLEANQFSGSVPPELGKLINLETLILSSNQLSGKLPSSFAELRNLTDFRINDNNFGGAIPDFIQNWKQLGRLEMQASGLQGPIPSNMSLVNMLTDLRISDINGTAQEFPNLSNTTGLIRLVLRNCNISGEIPEYVWKMMNLHMLLLRSSNHHTAYIGPTHSLYLHNPHTIAALFENQSNQNVTKTLRHPSQEEDSPTECCRSMSKPAAHDLSQRWTWTTNTHCCTNSAITPVHRSRSPQRNQNIIVATHRTSPAEPFGAVAESLKHRVSVSLKPKTSSIAVT